MGKHAGTATTKNNLNINHHTTKQYHSHQREKFPLCHLLSRGDNTNKKSTQN